MWNPCMLSCHLSVLKAQAHTTRPRQTALLSVVPGCFALNEDSQAENDQKSVYRYICFCFVFCLILHCVYNVMYTQCMTHCFNSHCIYCRSIKFVLHLSWPFALKVFNQKLFTFRLVKYVLQVRDSSQRALCKDPFSTFSAVDSDLPSSSLSLLKPVMMDFLSSNHL